MIIILFFIFLISENWPIDYQQQYYLPPYWQHFDSPTPSVIEAIDSVKKKSKKRTICLDKIPGKYPCPECGKEYRWIRNMKHHYKVHLN